MERDTSDGLNIECSSTGRAQTVTARFAGEVIAVDSLDLRKSKARDALAAAICDGRAGIAREDVDAELLKLAADLADRPEVPAETMELPELDATAIVRPERIMTDDVSGVSVATMTMSDNRPAGRWLHYLHWNDGRREQRQLGPFIDLPDGRRLWIHPTPTEPTPNTPSGWSAKSRKGWVAGETVPNATDLFRRLCGQIAHFIELPMNIAPGITATLATWTILTYVYSAWDAVPYLYIGGPLGSGKSRVFEILARLVFRPLVSSNMTAAALFRTLHAQGGTLLLDEAERLRQTRSPDVQEILSMLLAGYKRGGTATRLESVGDTFKTVTFDVYGPKALACIAGLPPALASRSIAVAMFRASPGSDKPRRRIDANPEVWQKLRDDLHVLALEHGSTWLELSRRVDVCPRMHGRDFELWQPLLALAAWLESLGAQGLLTLLQDHAVKTIDRSKEDQTPDSDETILRILADAVRIGRRITPNEILEMAKEVDASTFKSWHPRTVTSRLKSYGIPTPKKSGSRREFRQVTRDQLRDIQIAYGIDLEFPIDEITSQDGF